MEAGYSEEKFKQHIRTVVAQAESDSLEERPLTFEELKELALSMGMSENEWDDLQKKAYEYLRLAEDHLRARNFEAAIEEAEKTTAINPYIANGNSVLAKAYQMLWLEDDYSDARDKAEYYARKELLSDPKDTVAIKVLSAINKKKKTGNKDAKSRKQFLIYGGIGLAVILIAAFFFSRGSSSAESNELKNDLIIAEEEMNAKYDLVQTAIDQRNSMLPELFGAVDDSHNDLNAVNGEIESLKNDIQSAEGDSKFELESELDKKIAEAKKLVKAYGNPENVETLMIQIEGAENRIAYEKKAYNDAVKNYNILVKQSNGDFPEFEIQPYYNAN